MITMTLVPAVAGMIVLCVPLLMHGMTMMALRPSGAVLMAPSVTMLMVGMLRPIVVHRVPTAVTVFVVHTGLVAPVRLICPRLFPAPRKGGIRLPAAQAAMM
ncbi:hypothetical protein [Nesterenkonia populi]